MKRFFIKTLLAFSVVLLGGFASDGIRNPIVVQATTVYYTPKGKSMHYDRDCPRLARSKTVYSGDDSQVKASRPDICDVCGYRSSNRSSNNNSSKTVTQNQNVTKVEKNRVVVSLNSQKLNDYLKSVYKNAFNREIDNEGFNYWYNHISTGKSTIQDFVLSVLNSQEFKDLKLDAKSSINRAYKILFGRDADNDGLNYWVSVYNKNYSNNKNNALTLTVKKMMESEEFVNFLNSVIRYK